MEVLEAYRCGIQVKVGQVAHLQVDGFVHIHNGHIALANIDLAGGIAALAVFIQIVQAQGFQRGTLLPVDLFALAAIEVIADAAPAVFYICRSVVSWPG